MRWRRDRGAQQHAGSASLGEIEGFHLAPDIDESAREAAKTRAAAHTGSPALDTHSFQRFVGQGARQPPTHQSRHGVHWPTTTRTRLRSRCGEQRRPELFARPPAASCPSRQWRALGIVPPTAVTRRPRGASVVCPSIRASHGNSLPSNLLAPEKESETLADAIPPGSVCGQAPSLHGTKAARKESASVIWRNTHVRVPRLSSD